MIRKCLFAVAYLLLASTINGQQTPSGPSPSNVSTAPPRRYSAEEMSRFRSMRTASQPGVTMSLGDQLSRSRPVSPTVQAASYQSQPSDQPPRAINNTAAAAPIVEQPVVPSDDIPVPEILSGRSPATTTANAAQNFVPDEVKLGQLPVAASGAPTATAESTPGGIVQPIKQEKASRPEMKTFGATSGANLHQPQAATRPVQNPIDLRSPPENIPRSPAVTNFDSSVERVGAQEDVPSVPEKRVAAAIPEVNTTSPFSNLQPTEPASTSDVPSSLPLPKAVSSLNRSPSPVEQAAMHSAGAEVSVSTNGPKSISIGKNATYGVEVTNSGQATAQQLEVVFLVPAWIEVANANVTSGSKDMINEAEATRVLWHVGQLEPGKTQQLMLDVIPRKAQAFELNVEWSVAPVTGSVQVQVTEPLLTMEIAGPDEVQFGQTAMYNVCVRNPGTGVAENVVVALCEALGGEQAPLGNLGPGEEQNIQVELIARDAGALELGAEVCGDSDLKDAVSKQIRVRRAQLEIAIQGPAKKYAGAVGNYIVTVQNTGDAPAEDVFAAIGIPTGALYLSGIESAEEIEGGMRWSIGGLPPGAQRSFTIACQLNAAGPIQMETGVRGAGELADAASIQTLVETEADLVLSVNDPQGPLPIGQDVVYQITVKNRGTKAAKGIDMVMHFSNGIEPITAEGRKHTIKPGEVSFESIDQIEPNEEVVVNVTAKATAAGTHEFRAQLTCAENDAREVAGGTTKFFGEDD